MVSLDADEGVVALGEDPPALLGVVAVEPDDERLGAASLAERARGRRTMPLATASQAVMPPKTLTNTP